MSSRPRRAPAVTALFICLVAGCAGLAGCSNESLPKCHPVRGKVTLDGKPLAEAMIVFHPLEDDAPEISKPLAYSGQDGDFELTTLQPRDGAPPGQYAITVELRELKADGDQMVRDGRNLLPAIYGDPKTSGFRFLVEGEPNEVPAIDLKSK